MLQGRLAAIYTRTGARFPLTVLAIPFVLQYLAYAALIGMLALYLPVPFGRYVVLALAAALLELSLAVTSVPFLIRRLSPTISWLCGQRGADGAEAAWVAAASLPVDYFSHQLRKFAPLIYDTIWCAFAVWELHLPVYGLPILVLAGLPVFLFTIPLLFLLMERTLRPLLEELSRVVPDGVRLQGSAIPLRVRLLVTLPAMNVVAGMTVAGIAGVGNRTVGRLGVVVGVSIGVAWLLAIVLAQMLSDSIVDPVERLHDATERVRAGDLSVDVPVTSVDETGALTTSFNRMVTGLRERERLREAFGTFVDPGLTERVLRDGADLAGEEVFLSVLFLDIRGFTTYSEQAEAQAVVARLNGLYSLVVPEILAHGGHANKFIGDGLLAIFGAPERLADHADRAVSAALRIAELVSERYAGSLRVGIGVNSGRVVVGTVGGGGRLDFTVIGDPVNTASRVEAATRQTNDDVLITSTTRALLTRHDLIGWEERPPLALKGKSEPITLFAPGPAPAPLQAVLALDEREQAARS